MNLVGVFGVFHLEIASILAEFTWMSFALITFLLNCTLERQNLHFENFTYSFSFIINSGNILS